MRAISLGSGSSGNALLVEAGPRGRTKILVDAGFSGRIIGDRLRQVGIYPRELQGVLITHEHIDHVLGLPALVKSYGIPVITAPATLAAIQQSSYRWSVELEPLVRSAVTSPLSVDWDVTGHKEVSPDGIDPLTPSFEEPAVNGQNPPGYSKLIEQAIPMPVGSRSMIGDIEIISFPVSHDAVAPCGYLLSAGGCRVCIAIDSGEVTPTMLEAMQHADLLVLESNHDRERLIRGP